MDVEAKLVAALSAALGCEVSASVPNPRPLPLVTVERTGGGRDNVALERPTVAVQCWGGTRLEASSLAREADAAMAALEADPWCYRVSKNSESWFPGEGDEPRYQLVYDMACDPRA